MVLDIFLCLANRADSISFIAFSLLLDIFFLEIPKTGKNFLYFSTFITLFTEFLHSSSTLWNPNTCRKNISCCIHQFKNLAATNFFRLIYRILQILMEKVREVLERNLKKDSRELVLLIRDDYCYGILNYPESEKESIRRSMKSSLTQMEIQKNMFQHVSFSMAVGAAYKEAEHLADSMQEARKLIQERLVKGDGRVLDCLGKASEIQESELLKKYLREITHAVEISSIQNAAEA